MADRDLSNPASKPIRAWVLDWPVHPIALAACEVVEILEAPEIHPTPIGPAWCRAMVAWRNELLALAIPEGMLLRDDALTAISVVIVAFQLEPLAPLRHAAIAVVTQPQQIEIRDGADCDAPLSWSLGTDVMRACFQFENRILVVPELSLLFGATPLEAAA
jgi:chemotaxis signal transduction protein